MRWLMGYGLELKRNNIAKWEGYPLLTFSPFGPLERSRDSYLLCQKVLLLFVF